MTEFFSTIKDEGVATTVIALLTIFLVGCIKHFPFIKNMKNTDARKAIYQILNLAISAGLALAYQHFVVKGAWNMEMLQFISFTMAEVNVIYPLYENLGARALIKKLGSLLFPSKANKISGAVDAVLGSKNSDKNSDWWLQ